MADDSILKPLDLHEPGDSVGADNHPPVESDEPVSTIPSDPSSTDRTSFLTVGIQKPWDIETNQFGKIARVNVVDEMKKSYLDYAMSVIVSRALPDARDGLKPVHRRILFGMKELALLPPAKYKKCARIVGEVLGKYHPHGDTAVYDALARLAQDFSMRYMLVDGQGNFGSVDGDSPAAMRYTEARLAKITGELLLDLEKETVNWIDNFDGTFQEPTVLPARLPNLLLMGSDGIAVGMATKIPTHNLGEIVDAIITLIKMGSSPLTPGVITTSHSRSVILDDAGIENVPYQQLTGDFTSEATVDDLLESVQGPDFPTGGVIYDAEAIREVYATGKGRVVTRAVAEIEETKSGKFQIVVTEIPYQVNKAKLIQRIADLVRDKKLDGISDLRDESDREGMRIVIELKKASKPKSVLNNLYKHTELQNSFPANMVALDEQGTPHLMNLKTILSHYVKHRQTVIVRRSQFELKEARARIHILEGLKIALDHLDEVIKTIRASKDTEDAKASLIKKFGFSEIQAVAILDMQLRRLSALERQKIEDEYNALMVRINELLALLKDPKAILSTITKELKELKEVYGDPRKTKVIKGKLGEFSEEDLVAAEDNLVAITRDGYVKRMPLSTYRTQRRGGKGVVGMTTKDTDEILHMTVGNTHDFALFFTNTGKVYSMRVFELPEGSRAAKGQAIINLLNIEQGEMVQAVLTVNKDLLKDKGHFITMATKNGMIKKTPLSQYESIRQSGKIGISLRDGDQLIKVEISHGQNYLILVTRGGKSIKFKETDVTATGRNTMGVKGITLKNGDAVIAMETVEITPPKPDDKRRKFFREILVVTEHGLGKRTDVGEYPEQKRGGQGVKVAELSPRTGDIASVRMVTEDDEQVVITTKAAQVIKLPLKNIKVLGRSTQGVILMRP
ncbi:MAG: gyrase subunit A protein [Microgenomates group bacterium GW2011_GWA2_46_16]|nr:MAG: gyrase subunit A protein [Microgenomates group bacterium GW2011_GWA2_46_16]